MKSSILSIPNTISKTRKKITYAKYLPYLAIGLIGILTAIFASITIGVITTFILIVARYVYVIYLEVKGLDFKDVKYDVDMKDIIDDLERK